MQDSPEAYQGRSPPPRCTFAQVVRGSIEEDLIPTRRAHRLKSVITVPVRSSYCSARSHSPTHHPSACEATPEVTGARRKAAAITPQDTRWVLVRPPYWWRKEKHSSPTQRPQANRGAPHPRRLCSARPQHFAHPQHQPSPSLRALWAKTDGRCFICLATDHRTSAC